MEPAAAQSPQSGSDPRRPDDRAPQRTTMRAVVHTKYGLDGLELREIEQPPMGDDGVLVRVRAVSINAAEWYAVTAPYFARVMGRSGLRRPKKQRLGADFAGTVEAVGSGVRDFRPGDDVFGGIAGAFGEYVVARPAAGSAVVLKPPEVSFEEAASVAIAATTALQGLRDHGGLQPGQKVLVNGASGGVGTFAVQIAKALGAEVTAVCSTSKLELAGSLGAERVVDYTREDFTRTGERYDLVFDNAASKSWSSYRRIMKPDATFVLIGAGGVSHGPLGPLPRIGRLIASSKLRRGQKLAFFIAKLKRPDMQFLAELLESGQVKPVVERVYELGEIAEALRYLGEGHARGKLVLTV